MGIRDAIRKGVLDQDSYQRNAHDSPGNSHGYQQPVFNLYEPRYGPSHGYNHPPQPLQHYAPSHDSHDRHVRYPGAVGDHSGYMVEAHDSQNSTSWDRFTHHLSDHPSTPYISRPYGGCGLPKAPGHMPAHANTSSVQMTNSKSRSSRLINTLVGSSSDWGVDSSPKYGRQGDWGLGMGSKHNYQDDWGMNSGSSKMSKSEKKAMKMIGKLMSEGDGSIDGDGGGGGDAGGGV